MLYNVIYLIFPGVAAVQGCYVAFSPRDIVLYFVRHCLCSLKSIDLSSILNLLLPQKRLPSRVCSHTSFLAKGRNGRIWHTVPDTTHGTVPTLTPQTTPTDRHVS